MKQFFREHTALVVGIGLPVLLVLFLAGSVYLPSLLASPSYDFVYARCIDQGREYYSYCDQGYTQRVVYTVENGTIVRRVENYVDPNHYRGNVVEGTPDVRLYYHDVSENTNRELTLEEAKELTLDGRTVDPDGFTLEYDRTTGGTGFFPFYSYDRSYQFTLTKGSARKPVDLVLDTYGYYSERHIQFVGWVLTNK